MKKITFMLLIILSLTLTACSGIASGSAAADPSSAVQNGVPTGALPASTQLIIGTLKLDETGNAVTAEQASELLPLWQTLQVLSESDTAADQETEALLVQIQETMTAEQIQAITGMNLTREDMFAVMQEQGLAMGASSQSSNAQSGNSSSNGGGGFQPGGSGMPPPPDERGPGAGLGGGQGSGLSPDQIATAQAARQAGNGNLIPPALLNALIEYLQKTAGS